MSNETQTEQVPTTEQTPSPYPKLIEKDGTTYELCTFAEDSANAGFYFYSKTYKDEESANKQLTSVKPDYDTKKALMAMFNSKLGATIRQNVSVSLSEMKPEEKARMLETGKNLLLDIVDCSKFLPGEREVYSESGILKRVKDLQETKQREKLKGADANQEVIEAINTEGKALMARLEELRTKKLASFED